MKAHRLPSGSWRVQLQIDGKRHSFTDPVKKEALRKAQAFELLHADAPAATLGILIDRYIDNKYNVLSPSTLERYKRIRKQYMQPLMSVPLNQLTAERIQTEVNIMAGKYAPKTVRNAYGLVSSTLKQYGIHYNITLPKKKPMEYHVPIEAQVWLMIDQASENLKTAIMLAAFCSLRRSEIVALRAEDITGNMIHVKRAAVYGPDNKLIYKDDNKTYHSDRYIQAPDVVIEHLKGKTGRVCPVVPSTITADFIRLRNKMGLTCRFHDLRHFFASFHHSLLIADQYIQKWGGWKSDAMLKAVYRNTLADVEIDSANKVNEHLNAHGVHTNSAQSQ